MATLPGLQTTLKQEEAVMAIQIFTDFTSTPAASAAIAQVKRHVQTRADIVRFGRPALVMHWVETPGGRFGCHWDIEIPAPQARR
jgi:hypothetical protein